MTKYQNATSTRRESRTIAGRFRGGKLAPIMAQAFRESESGMLSQSVTYELDPIAGRMITPITCELISVYVPVQAMYALAFPEEAYAGNTEIIREKLLSGVPLFGLEEESEISKRLGVVPRSIGGVKKVNEVARLAHNCAVNFLRRKKYVSAVQVLADNLGVTPAIIGQTVLDRLNGVLDPEDRVDGAVQLTIGTMKLPVSGIGLTNAAPAGVTPQEVRETVDGEGGGGLQTYAKNFNAVNGQTIYVEAETDPEKNGNFPGIYANMSGAEAGSVSLTDFYNAEKMDQLVREMRAIVDANPQYGEEMVTRWAHGLSVDNGKEPFILYERSMTFGQSYRKATDGASLDVSQSDLGQQISFTAPVPKTELGGVVITFGVLKPDETIASQPHPFLSEEWGAINYVSDELARDPVPVNIRELDADCEETDENTRAMYVGHNGLKRAYINYGFNRHIDLTTVAAKTAIWQLEVPMSVTPESVIYPADIEHYPFADETAEVCTYTCSSQAVVTTPLIFGPTPVEELAQIETDDIFEDADGDA